VGNPVRHDIIFESREKAREKYNLQNKTCILSFGGSLGAMRVNEAVADLIKRNANNQNFLHIHSTGAMGYNDFVNDLIKKGVDTNNTLNLDIRPYIDDMPTCMAAADLVISRAGAITLSEIQATGTAAILIPSPNVAENHQYHNAMVLQNANAAVVIEEKDLTSQKLIDTFTALCKDGEKLKTLSKNAAELAILDCADRIYNAVMGIL
jgi:UDP-N-acetylglucosamine--N-acetylmuramyl-(pentapeptide) pyrophosphoryl-undecaprenol N-acetylglucosamine transferase